MKRVLINEGAESRNMSAAKHYLYKLGFDEAKALKFIGAVKTDIPNVRLQKCKFILGVVRMAKEGQLTDGPSILALNKTLKLVANETHVNEYNQDLNGMSCEELVNRFKGAAVQDLQDRKAQTGNQKFSGQSDYNIVRITSFEEAESYGDYVDWCVTHDDDMYNNYTHGGMGLFYFCLKNGFENVEEVKGEGCPLDEYGLSMIAVSVNEDGSCNTITCRWNHANGGNDNIMTDVELSKVINRDFYKTFLPYSPEEIRKKRSEIVGLFKQWVSNEDCFYNIDDDYYSASYGYCNVDNTDGELRDENDEPYYDSYGNIKDEVTKFIIIQSDFCDIIEDIIGSDKYMIYDI
jgi:hypothetical protein